MMPLDLTRLDHWVARLEEEIATTRARDFEWGQNDCVCFAARVVKAVTGVVLVPRLEGSYDTRTGALARISDMGFSSLEELVTSFLGEPVPPLAGRRGDIVQWDEFALGAVDLGGEFIIALNEDAGFSRIPLSSGIRAWRVG